MGAEARLAELKLELPPAPKPVATYVTAMRIGDLLYVSGHGPYKSDGTLTGAERRDLQHEQNQASHDIYRQKHDEQDRPPAAVRDPRPARHARRPGLLPR